MTTRPTPGRPSNSQDPVFPGRLNGQFLFTILALLQLFLVLAFETIAKGHNQRPIFNLSRHCLKKIIKFDWLTGFLTDVLGRVTRTIFEIFSEFFSKMKKKFKFIKENIT